MADWFDFKGVRSTDLGVRVIEFPPTSLPEERQSFETVLGRSGSLTVKEGEDVYEDVLLSIYVFVENLTALDQIATWLRGSGMLILGNDPTRYYKATPVNQLDMRKILRDHEHRTFSPIFRCHPYRYHYPPTSATALTNGGYITNPGNIFSQPKYVVSGTGNILLTVGDKTIDITGLSGSITIDVELGLAYQTGSSPLIPLTSIVGREDWPFKMNTGRNDVSWSTTGSVSSVTVEPRWRDV